MSITTKATSWHSFFLIGLLCNSGGGHEEEYDTDLDKELTYRSRVLSLRFIHTSLQMSLSDLGYPSLVVAVYVQR